MKVERFSRLRNCGIFRDFRWPDELPDFGKFNLIYGWNGTGKTTLSRLLRDLELRRDPGMREVTVRIDGREVRGADFRQATVQVRVFNRDFIDENVFRADKSELPPIFVLGRKSVELQQQVERLRKECCNKEAEREKARQDKESAEREFERHCTERARAIKETLRSSGTNRYNNYDKTDYKNDANNMSADGDSSAHRLADSQRNTLLAQLRATPKLKLTEVSYRLPSLQEFTDSVSQILHSSVVAEAIEALRADAKLSEWTREGLRLHKERGSDKCLFCEQPLSADRVEALEAHFSTEYEKFLRKADELIAQLRTAKEAASGLDMPKPAEFYEDLADEYAAAERLLRQTLELTQGFLEKLIELLGEKKTKLFDRLELTVEVPSVDAGVVGRLNAIIRKHNQACDDFESRVNEARERLARDMIAETVDEYIRLRRAVQCAAKRLTAREAELQRRKEEVERLEREIVDHRQPAEELNDDLREYLGHGELRLEIKDTGYIVTRNDEPAHTLSEGEITAIALLYFLKSLRDRSFDVKRGVVVLDDPVSSLDAHALYLAFGFIRERTKDAAQLFIFTHNFTFFRQVRNWFHHLKGQKKKDPNQRPARFYMLDCRYDTNGRCTAIRALDPLLEGYESEYQYLFSRIYRAAHQSGSENLEDNYALPNMARRLLEAFLAFRQPHVAGQLWEKMEGIAYDAAKKTRILRLLHTHSHADAVSESEHDPSLLAEGGAVLRDLLEFIKTQDKAHFEAMEKLVNRPNAEDDHI